MSLKCDHPVDSIRGVVVRLRDGRRGERVGLDDVGAGQQHLAVDLPDYVWTGMSWFC